MKKIIATLITVSAVFYTVTLITACKTPPAPPPAQTEPTPSPPPFFQPEEEASEAVPDTSPPEITVEFFPQPYSPISPDGEEQFLTVKINVKSASPIDTWSVELREPEGRVFLSAEQKGEIPETLIWNGRNPAGELAESATVYLYSFRATNTDMETATCQGTLAIDVLVKREEKGLLRIIVPSIVFAPNSWQLGKGLDSAAAANNEKILKRIAEILGYFENYNIKVEGHANPISPPNSSRRSVEETRGLYRGDRGLQPLSEERAKAVVEYLSNLGVNRSRLTPVGMGAKKVRAEFTDKANWWKNRRVEFILEKPEP